MKVCELIEILPDIMEIGEVPMLVGHAGIGKTEAIKQIGERYGRKVIVLILSQMEPGDLIGMPDRRDGRTVWLAPEWWPEDGRSIIFLDEINRAHETTRTAVMQLLVEKRLHNHVLPEGTWLVAAMNPSTDGYSVDEIFDRAFIDRFVWIKVTNDFKSWREYIEEKMGKKAITYIEALKKLHDTDIESFQLTEDFDLPDIKPTPRAHERLLRIVQVLSKDKLEKFGHEIFTGVLGKQHGRAMYRMYKEFLKEHVAGLEDLLSGNVEAFKNTGPQIRAKVVESFIVHAVMNDLTDEELENATKVLETFKKEELGVIVRKAFESSKVDEVIKGLKKRNERFANLINNLVLGGDLRNITKLVQKLTT